MSIITEALKKAAKEKDKTRKHPNKAASLKKEETYKSAAVEADEPQLKPRVSAVESESIKSNAHYVKSRTLIVSGIVLLLAIAFLTITNIFLLPSINMEEATPVGTSADSIEVPVEAEAYTDVKSETALIEGRESLIDKMAKALKIESTQDEFLSSFILNGIVYDTDDSWAIINNKIVRVGDTLDGATVISIAPQKVVLLFKEERFDLAVK